MIAALTLALMGVTPTVDELATARQWVSVTFDGAEPAAPKPGIEVVANHDPVQKNGRFGRGLKSGGTEFTRGLFCHAPSHLIIRLPGPAKTFSAVIGVDSNEQTMPGKGSIVFSAKTGDKQVFASEVMREGMAAVPVSVDLGGATELSIEVGDGGDGISCDQADWADAKVVMADGSEICLDELPLVGGPLHAEGLPFSFTYDGQPSSELLKTWKTDREMMRLTDGRKKRTLTFTDPKTGLAVRCVSVEYPDFPTVEWTLCFKNTGTADTPIIENIQALDVRIERGDTGEFLLHHAVGSPANGKDYSPIETRLEPNSTKRIGGAGGRPTNSDMSYFNIESTCGDGVIVAVGWPGQWASEFKRDGGRNLMLKAGQDLTHFKLLPGEEVRSPLIALQFWKRDWIGSQNIWRRWMIAYNIPRPGGKLPPPMLLGCSSRAYEEMIKTDDQKQIMFIDRYLEEGLKIDYWWMDAGWYIQKTGWPQVGTWEVDPARFPSGFKPVSDHAHANGIKILVWFEPERVAADTWLSNNHPEWIFGGKNGGLLNLGSDEARTWLTDHIDQLLTEQGIDLYRQDFNMDPLDFWRKNDAENRQGITEIKHVTGYLAYWDELRRRHPDMLIDSCASGGRRNDLETMRRAVPLWRSDYAFEPIGHQSMTYGISLWIPFHGTGTVACVDAPYYGGGLTPVQPYAFWSNVAPSTNCGFDMRVKEIDYAALRKLFAQYRAIAPNYYGDFYPLTTYTMDKGAWMAWQFDRPETGEGMVQVFRRAESIYTGASLPLKGLDPGAQYVITDLASDSVQTVAGSELLERGLPVTFDERPAARVFAYQRVK